MSTNCGHLIYHINSSDQTEQSSMIGGCKVINPIYEGNQSLQYDEVLPQSPISQDNQDGIENEPLNSQLKKQSPAIIRQKIINKKPKIVIGLLVMLLIVSAGIGILVSQIQEKGDYERKVS